MDLQLNNKLALVSGSTAGIGLAIAKQLAQEQATVVINGRTQERVDSTMQEITKAFPKAKLIGVAQDLSTPDGVAALIKKVPEVDILVNNVGIYEVKPFVDISDDDWLHIFNVNVMSGIRLSRHYFSGMLKKNWGRIIFISSESGVQIPSEMIHYGMTKTAQLAISRGLAELAAGTGVTVNCVLPGPTRSEGVNEFIQHAASEKRVTPEALEKDFFINMRPTSLIKRFATTEEVASMVCYLSSPLSSATTGAAIRVDGGVVKSIT